jgi:hypothetical protein
LSLSRAKTMAPRKPYEGVLSERMSGVGPHEYLERVVALFEHYGVKPNEDGAEMKLLMALAADWVPGFKFANRKGRPAHRTADDIKILVECFRADEANKSISAAAHRLAKRGSVEGLSGEQIRQRYLRMKREGLPREVMWIIAGWAAEDKKAVE